MDRALGPWSQSVPYPPWSPVALSTSEFSRVPPASPLAVALQGWGEGCLYQEGRAGQRARPGRGGRGETCSLQSRLLLSAALAVGSSVLGFFHRGHQGLQSPARRAPSMMQKECVTCGHSLCPPRAGCCPQSRLSGAGLGGKARPGSFWKKPGRCWPRLRGPSRACLQQVLMRDSRGDPAGYTAICAVLRAEEQRGLRLRGLLEGGQGYPSLAGDRQVWLCMLGARVDWGLQGLLPLPPGPSQPASRAVWGRRGLCHRRQGPLLPTAAADQHCPGPAPGRGPKRACASSAHTRLFLATSSPGVRHWGLSVGRPLGLETSGEGEEAGI